MSLRASVNSLRLSPAASAPDVCNGETCAARRTGESSMSSTAAAQLGSEEQLLTDELNLAAEFAPATNKAWLKLVDKVLGGADFEKVLVGRTYDGLTIEPLYTSEDWPCVG